MAEILGVGLSHFPGFIYADDEMSMRVKQTMLSPKVPAELKEPANWPGPMRSEWGVDEGTAFATEHRAQYFGHVRKVRAAIDDFQPDFVLIFGDDQYENFREDIVPPFCVYAFDSIESQPFLHGRAGTPTPNVWGDPNDKTFVTKGHPQAGRYLARYLLQHGFDVPYAYKTHHHSGLGHAFINTLLYLDYDRTGWSYPVLPFHVNAYGSNLIRGRGLNADLFAEGEAELDPPAPSPSRCFELGQSIARAFRDSPWRVVIIGSSSWSHAFLTKKHHFVYPDVPSDRQRFEELRAGNFGAWRDLPLEQLEGAGQHELLNWVPMVGAMYELGQGPAWCEFVESYLMNSCKVVGLFPPGQSNAKTQGRSEAFVRAYGNGNAKQRRRAAMNAKNFAFFASLR